MDTQNERRHAADRRALAVYHRYGNERRNYTENRRTAALEEDATHFSRVTTHGYWGASGSLANTTKEIAEAFGLSPESLEMVEHDELISDVEHCQACAIRDGMYAELEVKLALTQKTVEQYRKNDL